MWVQPETAAKGLQVTLEQIHSMIQNREIKACYIENLRTKKDTLLVHIDATNRNPNYVNSMAILVRMGIIPSADDLRILPPVYYEDTALESGA